MTVAAADLVALVDPKQTAVLVVDIQEVFVRIPTLYPPVEEVLPRLHRFIHEARSAGGLVVVIQIAIPPELYSENWKRQYTDRLRPLPDDWLAPGSEDVALHPGFEPQAGDVLITKPRYSAFIGTSLEAILHSNGIRTVIAAGLTTDVCVGSTARDAFQRDFTTITLADCTAEGGREQHEVGLRTLAQNFGMVCTSTEVIAAWQEQRASIPV